MLPKFLNVDQFEEIVPVTVVSYFPAASVAEGLASVKKRTRMLTVAAPAVVDDIVTKAIFFPLA